MKNNPQPSQYKYLTFLSMALLVLSISAGLLYNKVTLFGDVTIFAASLITPLTFVLFDIISEVYGYRICRKTIWLLCASDLLFSLICTGMLQLSSSEFLNSHSEYVKVFAPVWKINITGWIAFLTGSFINVYCVSKWKILTNGKYFWLRSIGSTAIGGLCYNLVLFIAMGIISNLDGSNLFSGYIQLMAYSYLIKLFSAIFFAFPANVIATLLKSTENVNAFDTHINYNPFKISASE